MQINIIQFFQNSGVVTSLCVLEKQEQLPSFALKDNGKSQSIPVSEKYGERMNFQMEEITTVFASLNRTWSVKTYNVETKKINWPVATSVSA